jgi:V-type H+-transporting ATPase subunit a
MIQLEEIPFKTLKPPTHFYVNDFTYPFQEIVNTYGVPSYKEINPSFFTYVTFPFLFGVMFGDIGHGALLLLVASILCLFSSCLNRFKFLQFPMKCRYMLLLMGLFATFSGVIYNDFVSMPLSFSNSCYPMYHKGYNST